MRPAVNWVFGLHFEKREKVEARRTMKQTLGMAALAIAIAIPAAEQTKPQPKTPAKSAHTTPAAGASSTSPDQMFAREAALGGMAEVDLGNLAKEKASSND